MLASVLITLSYLVYRTHGCTHVMCVCAVPLPPVFYYITIRDACSNHKPCPIHGYRGWDNGLVANCKHNWGCSVTNAALRSARKIPKRSILLPGIMANSQTAAAMMIALFAMHGPAHAKSDAHRANWTK